MRTMMRLSLLFGISAVMSSAADEVKMVPLVTTLPKPPYESLQNPYPKIPNIEPWGRVRWPRVPFMVPEGTTNLAREKKVTSSDSEPVIGALKQVTDGDKEIGELSYVELGRGKQWVQIDLGGEAKLYAVVLWLFYQHYRVYYDVVVQVSDDEEFKKDVKIIFNNDHDNSSGFGIGKDLAFIEQTTGKLIDAKGVVGRYVRINTNGNNANEMNHYTEVEVWGKPVEKSSRH